MYRRRAQRHILLFCRLLQRESRADHPAVPPAAQDVFDTRDNGWRLRRKAEGPKKIEDVHKEAMRDASLNLGGDRGGPRGPRGGGGYDGGYERGGDRGYPPARNPYADRAQPLQEAPQRPMNVGGFPPRQSSAEMSFRPQSFGMKGPGGRQPGPPPPPMERQHSAPVTMPPPPPPASERPVSTPAPPPPAAAAAAAGGALSAEQCKQKVHNLFEAYQASKNPAGLADDARDALAGGVPAAVLVSRCMQVRMMGRMMAIA